MGEPFIYISELWHVDCKVHLPRVPWPGQRTQREDSTEFYRDAKTYIRNPKNHGPLESPTPQNLHLHYRVNCFEQGATKRSCERADLDESATEQIIGIPWQLQGPSYIIRRSPIARRRISRENYFQDFHYFQKCVNFWESWKQRNSWKCVAKTDQVPPNKPITSLPGVTKV